MKKIILGLALLFAISSVSMAQRGSNRKQLSDKKVTSSKSNDMPCCDLTQAQMDEMKKIRENYSKEKDAILKSRITKAMQDKKIEELDSKKKSDIQSLLTDEQKKQWDERKSDMKSKSNRGDRKNARQDRGRRSDGKLDTDRPGGYGSIWMLAGIELSDKQKEEYKKLAESYKAENDKGREERRSERIKQEDKRRNALKKILTDDQKKVFEENLKKIDEQRENRNSK